MPADFENELPVFNGSVVAGFTEDHDGVVRVLAGRWTEYPGLT